MHGYHPPKLGRVIIIVMLHAGVKGVSERGELTPFTPACNTGLTKINDQHNTVIIIIIILLLSEMKIIIVSSDYNNFNYHIHAFL